jgi:hypothetical protein
MKTKITLILAFIGMITLQSCTVNENDNNPPVDNDTISEVFELKNINFAFDGNNKFSIFRTLTPKIYASDVILIYRLSGTIDSNTPIWQLIPRTLYLPQGELDYDFDFSKEDFTIYAGGTYDLTLTPNYLTNQTFRIVIVPGAFSNKTAAGTASLPMDYESVISRYNIDDSKIQKLN